jgi:hypothetical protein
MAGRTLISRPEPGVTTYDTNGQLATPSDSDGQIATMRDDRTSRRIGKISLNWKGEMPRAKAPRGEGESLKEDCGRCGPHNGEQA